MRWRVSGSGYKCARPGNIGTKLQARQDGILGSRGIRLSHLTKELQIDRGSIRSSLRYGLSTPYKLTIKNSARLFHIIFFNMGDLHLVLPALNLSTLNTGILIMIQEVRLVMFSLNMVDYSMSFLWLST